MRIMRDALRWLPVLLITLATLAAVVLVALHMSQIAPMTDPLQGLAE